MLIEFGTDERIKIVHAKVRLGALGEVLHLVCQAVMLHCSAGVEQHFFVGALGLGFFVCIADGLVLEAVLEHLVMIGVRQLVQDHVRVLGPLAAVQQRLGAGDVDVFHETRIMLVRAEPCDARVILHRAKRLVVVIQPDRQLLQRLHLGLGEDIFDPLQVVGQRGENLAL